MKRIISFVLCLSMLLSMLPVSAFAADVEEVPAATEAAKVTESTAATEAPSAETTAPAESAEATEPADVPQAATEDAGQFVQEGTEETLPAETEEVFTADRLTWVPDRDLPSDEELFAGYAQQQFYGDGIATFGTAAGETLDPGHKKIYDALAKQIAKIAAGDLDSAVIPVGKNLGEVSVTWEDGTTEIYDCTPEEVIDVDDVELDLQNLLDVLLSDFPYDLYWFDKTAGVSVVPIGSYAGEVCFVFHFSVCADYSFTGQRYTYDLDTTVTGAASASAANARAIVAKYAASGDYEKLVAYRDEICDLTEYNHPAVNNNADYGDPWQMIWVFDNDPSTLVVCEGYSKAYHYLCDMSTFAADITCYNVVGTLNGGAHMWNIVNINGSSYLVDVTNYDAGWDLFLRGGKTNSSGGYTFDTLSFVYDADATALWGTGDSSILTLDTADFDPDSLTDTPGTEPDEGGDDGIMTGEELVAILESWTDPWYELTEAVVITTDITLPSLPVNVYSSGSITVRSGGSLTIANSLGVANGGMLTVEAGGTMIVDGSFAMGGGSTTTIDGTLINNNYVNIGQGTLVVNGTYTAADDSYSSVDIYGSVSGNGIDTSLFDISAVVYSEESLIDALVLKEGFGSQSVMVVNYDLNGDGAADPVVLTKDVTIPEGIDFQVGYYTGESAVLRIAEGVTLSNNGFFHIISDGVLVLENGAALVNNEYLSNNGSIISYGTIAGEGTFEGNEAETRMSQAQLLALLEAADEVTVSSPLTLTSALTIPAGKTVVFETPGSLVVPGGESLTVAGSLEFPGSSMTVQAGGSLVIRSSGRLGFYGASALTIENGAVCFQEDGAEIYANEGTTLTGITKAEVVNSNMIMDPSTNLQEFAETYGAGYKKFYLSIATDYVISEDMTLADNIVLDHYGNTVTITGGATLTVNGDWVVGMDVSAYGGGLVPGHIVVKSGELVVGGTLDLLYGSTLRVAEGSGTVTGNVNGTIDTYVPPMTGEELIAALEACTEVNYELTQPVVISSDIELPAFPAEVPGCINVSGNGSITIQEGGSLTTENSLDFTNGGTLTVEAGGSLTAGVLCVGVGGRATVNGDYFAESVVLNYPGTISGIDPSEINFYGIVWDEASLTEALAVQGYATHEVDIPGHDLDGDGSLDPVVLTRDTVIPEGCYLLIGDEMCSPAVLKIADGITLTNNGTLATWMGASLILGEDALLTGDGAIYNDGTITSYGTIEGVVEGIGTVTEYMNQAQFQALLNSETDIYISKLVTLTSAVTIPEGTSVTLEEPGSLVMAEGAELTVAGDLFLAGASLTAADGTTLEILGGGQLYNDGILSVAEDAAVTVYGSLSGSGSIVNDGLLHVGEKDDYIGYTDYYTGEYTQGETGRLAVELCDGYPLECTLIDTAEQELVYSGSLYPRHALDYAAEYASVTIHYTDEEGYGEYWLFPLDDSSTVLTIAENVTLNLCTAFYLPEGITLDNYGTLNVGTEEIPGQLTVCGLLNNGQSGSLTVGEGSTMILDIPGTVNNGGSVIVGGMLDIYGVWQGEMPTAVGNGIVSDENMADQQDIFERMLADAAASGETAMLSYDLELARSLQLIQPLIVAEGVTLTVPEGVTLLNNGQIFLLEDAALVVNGKLLGSLPCMSAATARFAYAEGSLAFNQTELEKQLVQSAETGMPVYLSVPLTLTKDLEIPEGAWLMPTGSTGVITIPAERTLTNNGTIQMMTLGGITARDGGTLANNGTIAVFNRGVLNMSGGFYVPGEYAELQLCYNNEGPGTGIGASIVGDIYEHVTFLVEGWDEEHIRDIMTLAENMAPVKALEIYVSSDLTLTKDLVLPEYASLYIGELGRGSVTVTVPRNITLTNNGCIEIGLGGTLVVKKGGSLVNNQPVLLDETAVYSNEGALTQADLEALLANAADTVVLPNPVVLETDLQIPEGVELLISGKGNYLVIPEGAELINYGRIYCEQGGGLMAAGGAVSNCGWIYAQNQGVVDMTDGSLSNLGGYLYQWYGYDAQGNITWGEVTGVDPMDLTVTVETDSDEAVIREVVDLFSETAWEYRSFQIRFTGDAFLTADMTIPEYASTVIPYGSTLTVPEGITLTDESGMMVYGTLIAEGTVTATMWPIVFSSVDSLVHPENCTNYIIEGLTVESISIEPTRTHTWTGFDIGFSVTYYPTGAVDTKEIHYEIIDGIGTLNEYNLLTSDVAGSVTVRATMVDHFDENGLPVYSDIYDDVTVYFYEDKQVSIGITKLDYIEEGGPGIYAGSSTQIYANVYMGEEVIESDTLVLTLEGGEGFAALTEENGVYTVKISEDLKTHEIITIHAFTTDDSAWPFSVPLHVRPKAAAVNVTLGGETVTGQTVLFDLNREDSWTVALDPTAAPADAFVVDGTSVADAAPLVQWTSSNPKVATVDENGHVTFTGATGKVKITMTASFGSKKTAAVTFNVVSLPQEILPGEGNADVLIGGSSAAFTVTDGEGNALKSSAVKWFLCDKDGAAIASHPYASVTAAGKLTTKAVADETKVYLMAQVIGDENSARLSEPVVVTLYPAVASVQILDAISEPVKGKTLLYDVETLGLDYPLSWSAEPYMDSVKSVSWKSSKPAVASIDQDGWITVADYDASGTVKFTLTVTAWNNKKTTAAVTMKFGTFTQDLYLSAKLPDGSVTDELSGLVIYSGQSLSFFAENIPENVTTAGVTWSLDSKTYATISKGVLKAKTVSNPVTVTVLVSSKDGACAYEIPVTILPKQDAVVLWNEYEEFITKTTQTLEAGDSIQLYASEDVTWSSSKPGFASVDPDTGLVEAYAAGSTTITAATADGRKASFTLKVTKPFANLTITTKKGEPFEVASGKALTLVGKVEYADGTSSTKVTWKVSDTSLATISSAGKLTAAKGLTRPAVVYVTATAKDSTWSTTKAIRVLPLTTAMEVFGPFGGKYPVDVTNTTQKWDIAKRGTEFTLNARTFPDGAMETVTWKSSSAKVAAVDQEGNVTCLKAGTVTITATAGDGSGKKASFKLTIHRTMAEDSLQLPDTAFVGGGKSLTLTTLEGYAIDPDATNKTLTWTLTYPDGTAVPKTVATLSKGVLKTKAVKAPVELLITAAATDGSGETAQCTVTVYPVIKGITLYTVDSQTGDLSSINGKTVSVPVNEGFCILLDATNVAGFGYTDDKTADEYLANAEAWTISFSKAGLVRTEFDGQSIGFYADGAVEGQSVKITLKANDGSGKSASFTIKFAKAEYAVPVTLSVWASQADQEDETSWLPVMLNRFAALHPEYEITWDIMVCNEGDAATFVSRDPANGPDVYMFSNDQLGTLVECGALTALEGSDLAEVENNYAQVYVDNLTHTDGGVYGIPMAPNTWFMFYNKSIFSEEDVRSLDTMLEKGGVSFPMTNSWYTGSFLLGAGGTIFGEKGNNAEAGFQFGSEECIEAVRYMAAFAAHDNFFLDEEGSGVQGMAIGEVGALFSGTWDYDFLKDALGDDLGVTQLPVFTMNGKEYQMKSFASCKAVGVNPYGDTPELAMEVAEYLASPESQMLRYQLSQITPAASACLENVEIQADPAVLAEAQQMRNAAVVQPTIAEMSGYWDPMRNFGCNIVFGSVTADNAAENLAALMEQLNG